jgi:hypothetical protein
MFFKDVICLVFGKNVSAQVEKAKLGFFSKKGRNPADFDGSFLLRGFQARYEAKRTTGGSKIR